MHIKVPLSAMLFHSRRFPIAAHPCARTPKPLGPVSTIMPIPRYRTCHRIVNKAKGRWLRRSSPATAMLHGKWRWGPARFTGGLYFNNRDSMAGSGRAIGAPPAPYWCTAGPGRAGGGEELGAVPAASCITCKRTAISGQPRHSDRQQQAKWTPGADRGFRDRGHPVSPRHFGCA